MCKGRKFFLEGHKGKTMPKYTATKFSSFLFETLEAVIYALIVTVVFIVFFFRIISISGVSMLNTLHDFDKVLVKVFSYRPKCGDVVIIRKGQYINQPIVKRIIATEGQSISIDYKNQAIIVNGVKIREDYLKEPMIYQNDDYIPPKIPKGYCFVMGDNRNKSLDSRSGAVGLIENKNIIGKVVFIVFSFHKAGRIK